MEKIVDGIANKIKPKLKEKKMTNKQFSLQMGKGESWFTQLPYAQCDIKLKDFMRASEILKVEASYLLGDNFSSSICEMSIQDMIKMLVKQECENYLKEKVENLTNLLKHIRNNKDV